MRLKSNLINKYITVSHNIKTLLLCPGGTETGFFDLAKIDSKGKSDLVGTNPQTPLQVVEAALRGLKRGSTVTISGFSNSLLAKSSAFIPNFLIVKMLARRFRPVFGVKK